MGSPIPVARGEYTVNRCQADVLHFRGEPKVQERTRAEQLEAQPLTVDDIVGELGNRIFHLEDFGALRRLSAQVQPRLSERQFSRFVNLMVDCYGIPFARQAGLAVGRPTLRAVAAVQ